MRCGGWARRYPCSWLRPFPRLHRTSFTSPTTATLSSPSRFNIPLNSYLTTTKAHRTSQVKHSGNMSDMVAVVCVLESSLTLAAEWPQVLGDYLVPLLARLGEAHTSPSVSVVVHPMFMFSMSYIPIVPHGLRHLWDRGHSADAYPQQGILRTTECHHEGDAGTVPRVWYRSNNIWWRARDGCARRDRCRSGGMSIYYTVVFYISRNPNPFAQHCLVWCFSHQPESSLSARIYLLRVRSHAVPPQRGVILLFHGAYPVDRHRIGYCHIMGKVLLV